MDKDILEALRKAQCEIHAPKNSVNQHMGFSFRSAEDILAAAKPVLKEYGLTLTIQDFIEQVGDIMFIKSVGYLNGQEAGSAFAQLETNGGGGLAPAQKTGLCSSYSRKYMLQGILLLDDGTDEDSTDEDSVAGKAPAGKKAAKKAAAKKTVGKNEDLQHPNPGPELKDIEPAKLDSGWKEWKIPFTKSERYNQSLLEICTDEDQKAAKEYLEELVKWLKGRYNPQVKFANKNAEQIAFVMRAVMEMDDVPFR